jgi:hypothetical protein
MLQSTYLSYDSIKTLMSGKELTAAERAQARVDLKTSSRTIGYITATHWLAAGIVGGTFEPFAWAAELAYWIYSTIAGDDDEDVPSFEVWMRNTLYDGLTDMGMAEDDKHTIVTLFAKGGPAALGADASSRLSFRNLFFSGMENNAEGGEWIKSALVSALGPAVGTVVKYGDSYKYAKKGDYLRAVEYAAPKMIKDVVRSYRFNTEGVNDTYGIPMRGELSIIETVLNSLGIQPTGMTEMYDKRSAIKSSEFRISEKRKAYIRRYVLASGPEERAEIAVEIRQFNKVVPKWARISYGKTLLPARREHRKRSAMSEQEGLYVPRKRRVQLEEGRSFSG